MKHLKLNWQFFWMLGSHTNGMGSFLDVVWVVLALGVSFQMKGEGASHFTFSTEGKYTVVCEIIKIYNINTFSKERKREREKERYSFQLWECKR